MIRSRFFTTTLCSFGGLSAVVAVLIALSAPHSRALMTTDGGGAFCPGQPHEINGPDGRPEPRPGYSARLIVGPRMVAAGQSLEMKLANEGADAITWQNGYVQRWTGRSWKKIPRPHAGSPEPLISVFEPPAFITSCIGPRIGPHWPPGEYRWIHWFKAHDRSGPDGRHRLLVAFRVVSARH